MSSDSESARFTSDEEDAMDIRPQQLALPGVLKNLRDILAQETHLFACGGQVPITQQATQTERRGSSSSSSEEREKRESAPVTIRWDTGRKLRNGQAASCAKVTLPLAAGAEGDLRQLVQDSLPATFGRGGEDVYDESYRKALKLDTDAFCSTFDPYSLGIIDTVAQVLLPSVIDSNERRAVEARLYKLNVYSGPSGKFKPHIDTPRSELQFGSLVVCLPVEHEGGQLKVRHKSKEMTFDWSTGGGNGADKPAISWAAFYSDCEHEVLEVTSGHRLTLTYNLYAVRGAGRLTGSSLTLDPTRLPLFQAVKDAMSHDHFDGKGGTIGFWCSHAYAYNGKEETPLPAALKGVDAALWEIFQRLQLDCTIKPVMQVDEDLRLSFEDMYDEDEPRYKNRSRRRYDIPARMPSEWIVGKGFGVYVDYSGQKEECEAFNDMFLKWGNYMDGPVHWLTTPTERELQLVYTAYGNDASANTMYSNCAILVKIAASNATKGE